MSTQTLLLPADTLAEATREAILPAGTPFRPETLLKRVPELLPEELHDLELLSGVER